MKKQLAFLTEMLPKVSRKEKEPAVVTPPRMFREREE